MTYLRQLKVVIASPSDVMKERQALIPVIDDVNNSEAEDLGLTLKTLRWETDAYPGFHLDGPQGLVDQILNIKHCDILIGIFWKRFGTPTADGFSEHEIYAAYEAWRKNGKPHIMLYFNQKEYFPKNSEVAQQQTAVLKFKEKPPKEGLYWEYKGSVQFEKLVRAHLRKYIRTEFKKEEFQPGSRPQNNQWLRDGGTGDAVYDTGPDLSFGQITSSHEKVKEIEITPIKPQTVSTSVIVDGTISSAKQVSKNEMEEIYIELTRDTTKNRKQATITKLRFHSDSKRIWKHSVTWEIISYLLNSDTTAIDGLYVIQNMIKLSQKEYPDDLNSVMDNVRERFLPRLLNLIQPCVEKRLSGDSFGILRIIIEENTLSRHALAALNTAMNELNDPEYSDYSEKYVWHFDQASKQSQEDLCNFMYDLTLKEDKVGTRARILYDHFIKKL